MNIKEILEREISIDQKDLTIDKQSIDNAVREIKKEVVKLLTLVIQSHLNKDLWKKNKE